MVVILCDFSQLQAPEKRGQATRLALRGPHRAVFPDKAEVATAAPYGTFLKPNDVMRLEPPLDVGREWTLALRCQPKCGGKNGWATPVYGFVDPRAADNPEAIDYNHFVVYREKPPGAPSRAYLAIFDPTHHDPSQPTEYKGLDLRGLRKARPEFDLVEFAGRDPHAQALVMGWLTIVVVARNGRTEITVRNARGDERTASCDHVVATPIYGFGGVPNVSESQGFGHLAWAWAATGAADDATRRKLLRAQDVSALPASVRAAAAGTSDSGESSDSDVEFIEGPAPAEAPPAEAPQLVW